MTTPDTPTTSAPSSVGTIAIKGQPSPAQVAAIVAAIEMTWPKPAQVVAAPPAATAWRWSGRWWAEGRLPQGWQ